MPETILVVEENREISSLISEHILGPKGYQIIVVQDQDEGQQEIRSERPDLILLGLETPRLQALAALDTLKADQHEIPVILMTSDSREKLPAAVFRKGVRDCISRPVESENLLRAVDKTLVETRLRREIRQLADDLAVARRKLDRREEGLRALYDVSQPAAGASEVDRLLVRIVEAAMAITGTEAGRVLILDDGSNDLVIRAARGWHEEPGGDEPVKLQDSLAEKVLQTGEPLVINNAVSRQKDMHNHRLKTVLCVPLKGRRRVIGVLAVDHRDASVDFSEGNLCLLSILADCATAAIESAELLGQTEDERRSLEIILSETEDMIVVTDERGQIVLMNSSARRGFGIGDGSVKGRPLPEVMKNQDILGLHEQPFNLVHGTHAEIALNGRQKLLATMSPIATLGRAIVMKDITHLDQRDRLKSDFIRSVAHDMRSPLTSVRGFVDLLSVVGDLNEEQQSFLNKIHNGIDDIVALVDDLPRVDEIKAVVDWGAEPCDLNEIIGSVVERFLDRVRRKKQSLTVETTPAPLLIRGVPFRLEHVVTNLVTNAVECTPVGGSIRVSSHIEGEFAVINVQADRVGIALSQQSLAVEELPHREGETAGDIEVSRSAPSVTSLTPEEHNGRIWSRTGTKDAPGLSILFRRVSQGE